MTDIEAFFMGIIISTVAIFSLVWYASVLTAKHRGGTDD